MYNVIVSVVVGNSVKIALYVQVFGIKIRRVWEALVMHDGEAARLCGCSELAMAVCLQVHHTR